ncbi:hypothetical protein [Bradyrhizobium sp. CCBAU 53380]
MPKSTVAALFSADSHGRYYKHQHQGHR